MKKHIVLAIGFLICITGNVQSQTPAASSWFKASQVSPGVWCIDDHGNDNMYLVIGKDSALLIDNGIGAANLRDYVNALTNLPLKVVVTHGHSDHAGSDYQFSEVYIHPDDMSMAAIYSKLPNKNMAKANNIPIAESDIFRDTLNHKPTVLKAVHEGYIFKLGGRSLEVIHVPGHTPGELVLLDKENKILFTGDNSNTLVWLFLMNCVPLEVYLESLEKLNKRANEFHLIFPGHGIPITDGFLDEQIQCVKNILDGTCVGEKYETFAGNGLLCTYKRASVAYNPDNLRKK
jgi:hydroxyacylglutathione hydrolase